MRVPILINDLPDRFNKVAKYIGRHWPTGKLGLNHAREHLAYMFGFNSVHELNKVADSAELPSHVSLDDVYASMLGKALYKYGVHPNQLSTVLYRTPFKELAFYRVTDTAKEQAHFKEQREKGFFLIHDEMQDLNSYKSPSLIIQQNNDGLLPKYTYAVRNDGKIFSSSYYESLINRLGDINTTVEEIGGDLTVQEFIDEYVIPFSWISLKDYLDSKDVDGEYNWKTPFMINVYHARVDKNHIGYVLYHSGLNAYYPAVFSSNEELVNALASLYQKEIINPAPKFPNIAMDISLTFNSKLGDYEIWREEDFSECERIDIDGQQLIRSKPFAAYTQLANNSILQAFKWKRPKEIVVTGNVIDSVIYRDHLAIRNNRQQILDTGIERMSAMSSEVLVRIFTKAFGNHVITIDDIIRSEYNDDYETSCDDEERWLKLGKSVLSHHPELESYFDILAIGNRFSDYQEFVKGNRWAYSCDDRDMEFIGYAFSQSPLLQSSRCSSEDDAFAGVLIISQFSDSASEDVTRKLEDNFTHIISMLTLYYHQERNIRDLEKYAKHVKECNPEFVTHGEPASYQEKSYNEGMVELMRMGRKFS